MNPESTQTKKLRKKLAASIIEDQKKKLIDKTEDPIYESEITELKYLLDAAGFGYPRETLARRINLLTKNEKKRVKKILHSVDNLVEEIDNIVATRAEIEHDPWCPEESLNLGRNPPPSGGG